MEGGEKGCYDSTIMNLAHAEATNVPTMAQSAYRDE